MLTDLKRYLRQRPMASLSDIALHLDVEPDVARALLERWISKGSVQRIGGERTCGGCDLCQPGAQELYRWIDNSTLHSDSCGHNLNQLN
jgi:hypothetical protein